MRNLSLGFSPCPNDTFIFDALVHQKIPVPYRFDLVIEDVEELNQRATKRALDLTKTSIHAWFHLLDEYFLLPSGGAMGRGCGPLLISREGTPIQSGKVALPGKWTTASLLFQLALSGDFELVQMPFDQVMPALLKGEVNGGVIIHESRFTYEQLGLKKVLDLGEWWEEKTNLPLPLGGILLAKDLRDEAQTLALWIQKSIQYATQHPEAPLDFIQEYAQEIDTSVQQNHIGLYVNEFSLHFGKQGQEALVELYRQGRAQGVLPGLEQDISAFMLG